jgi:AraC family transcriptional regulator of adaptative response/methylated-DNA-[protein]-cysteine methyltransferase
MMELQAEPAMSPTEEQPDAGTAGGPRTGRSDYARIERAIRFLLSHQGEQPTLEETAAELGLSEFHFQRLFLRWAGVSPKRFLQYLTLQRAKALLHESQSVLETSHALGLSGPGRLHDLFLSVEKLTPGEFKERARGKSIEWGEAPTPLGTALLAVLGGAAVFVGFYGAADPAGEQAAGRNGEGGSAPATRPEGPGVAAQESVDGSADGRAEALADLRSRFPGAELVERPAAVQALATLLCERLAGRPGEPLGVLLKGTPLQLKVWEALLRVPSGHLVSYGDVARLAGSPSAVRAVGTAIGANHLALLIPCHRVLRSTGAFGGYRWGTARKAALIGREQAWREATAGLPPAP